VGARSKARKRALDVLFEADQRGVPVLDVLAATDERRTSERQPALHPYVRTLVTGVVENQVHIDELLSTYSLGWTLGRMPTVDRCALRLGLYEMLFVDDVPDEVVIAETVALVADHSTDESPAFVNGLMARIKQIKPRLVSELSQST
jgi:transcription antitermination protein NusB